MSALCDWMIQPVSTAAAYTTACDTRCMFVGRGAIRATSTNTNTMAGPRRPDARDTCRISVTVPRSFQAPHQRVASFMSQLCHISELKKANWLRTEGGGEFNDLSGRQQGPLLFSLRTQGGGGGGGGVNDLSWRQQGPPLFSLRKQCCHGQQRSHEQQPRTIIIHDQHHSINQAPLKRNAVMSGRIPKSPPEGCNEMEAALVDLAAQTNLSLQWIPAHIWIQGNEQADRLARKGGQLDQEDRCTSYTDEKATTKNLAEKKLETATPKL